MRQLTTWITTMLCILACHNQVFGQSEVSGWGNLRGIRVGGQLVVFTTAVGVYNPDFTQATLSQREGPTRTTQYVRNGNTVTVGEGLQYNPSGGRPATNPATNPAARGAGGGRGGPGSSFNYTMSYTDSAPGVCDVKIQLTSAAAQTIGHLVNNGASCLLTVTGLTSSIAKMNVYITDRDRGMVQIDPLTVGNGSARFTLQGQTLTTLINNTP